MRKEISINDYTTILTYEDACSVLGERIEEAALTEAGASPQMIAQMKCELVAKAINDGKNITPNGCNKVWMPWFISYADISTAIERIAYHGEQQFAAVYVYDKLLREGLICGPVPASCESGDYGKDIDPRKDELYFETPGKARHFGLNFMGLWLDAHVVSFNYDKTSIFRINTTPKERYDNEPYALSYTNPKQKKSSDWWWGAACSLISILTFCLGRLILDLL